jgi:hypothetical protein
MYKGTNRNSKKIDTCLVQNRQRLIQIDFLIIVLHLHLQHKKWRLNIRTEQNY